MRAHQTLTKSDPEARSKGAVIALTGCCCCLRYDSVVLLLGWGSSEITTKGEGAQ